MGDVTEDLLILYRAVSRRQGKAIDYAGCVTAQEARRLQQMGLAKIVDVQADGDGPAIPGAFSISMDAPGLERSSAFLDSLRPLAGTSEILMFLSQTGEASHAAATLAAQGGFYCALNIIDGRQCYRETCSP